MGKQSFNRLDPVRILCNRSQRPPLRPGAVAHACFLHFAAQRARSAQIELGGPLNPVHGRRPFRKIDQLTAIRRYQQSIIRLPPPPPPRCFTLAVPGMVRKRFRGWVRLPPADPKLNRHVPDVPLRKLSKGLHFRGGSARGSRQRRHLLFKFRRSIPPSAGQPLVPNPHLLPVLKSLVLR